MEMLFLFEIILLCQIFIPPVQGASCPFPGFVTSTLESTGKCYWSPTTKRNWHDADKDCKKYDGTLVQPKTEEELEFILIKYLPTAGGNYMWIGMGDMIDVLSNPIESVFRYLDNTLVNDYMKKYWKEGEPNSGNLNGGENCGNVKKTGFNDDNCGTSITYVCEFVLENKNYATKADPYPCLDSTWTHMPGTDRCFISTNRKWANWWDSNAWCKSYFQGGSTSIATVNSKAEVDFLRKNVMLPGWSYWMGAEDIARSYTYKFVDGGGTLTYKSIWNSGEPNYATTWENCAELRGNGGMMDTVCGHHKPMLCQHRVTNYSIPEVPNVVSSGSSKPCPNPGVTTKTLVSTGKCYWRTSGKNWAESNLECKKHGGTLAMIKTAEEHGFIVQHFVPSGWNVWIGGTDIQSEGNYVYLDGTVVNDYMKEFWEGEEPNQDLGKEEDCIRINKNGLYDEVCSLSRAGICEFVMEQKAYAIPADPFPCPNNNWVHLPGSNICYFERYEKMTYEKADKFCREELEGDTSMAIVNSLQVFIFLHRNVFKTGPWSHWIGLNCLKEYGVWENADNTSFTYTPAWNSGQPGTDENKKCAAAKDKELNSYSCTQMHSVLCQYQYHPAPTTAAPEVQKTTAMSTSTSEAISRNISTTTSIPLVHTNRLGFGCAKLGGLLENPLPLNLLNCITECWENRENCGSMSHRVVNGKDICELFECIGNSTMSHKHQGSFKIRNSYN